MNKSGRLAGILAIAATLSWAVARHRSGSSAEAASAAPSQASATVTVEHGKTVVTLDAASQARCGIQVSTLEPVPFRKRIDATAVVLPVQDLVTLRNNYLTASAQVEKAKAALDVSTRESQRLQRLYEENQNASAKAVEAAEGAARADQAGLTAATGSLGLIENLAAQSWGNVVSKWVAAGSPSLDRVLAQKDSLLQVSLPPEFADAAPPEATIHLPNGRTQQAQLISAFPRVDPRLQRPTFLYITPTHAGLAPGMTLFTLLSSRTVRRGVVVPSEALIWSQNKAWAYVKISPERFARREVQTNTPSGNGWFVTEGFAPGDQVVTRGAQQVFSEETRSQIRVLGEGEEGDTD